MPKNGKLNIAIVHDWLVGGGAERVVHELHKMFPDAPIYTSYCSDEWRNKLDGKVITGYLQRWPFSKLRKFLAVPRIWWFASLDFSGYDLVISSSGNGEAFGIKTPKNTLHVNYCHSPTHYYWRHYDQYLKQPGFGIFNPLARLGLGLLLGPLRRWDRKAAQRPDYFIANSAHIQSDIKKYYGRNSVVIHPPIDVDRFAPTDKNKRHGFVTAGRLVPMKRNDIIVQTCSKLKLPLTVVGDGPDRERLEILAGPTVEFVGWVSDTEMTGYLSSAEAFVFASHEDFGVTPVEAMAAGTPVIAFKAGGALDYVIENKTGKFFDKQTVQSLTKTLSSFDSKKFDASAIQAHAQQFSPIVFRDRFNEFIKQATNSLHR